MAFLLIGAVVATFGWVLNTLVIVVLTVYGSGLPPENLHEIRWIYGVFSAITAGFGLFCLGSSIGGKKP